MTTTLTMLLPGLGAITRMIAEAVAGGSAAH